MSEQRANESVAPETRARRRIRRAVESRGYSVLAMDYEPWYDAGEMMGIGGGWSVLTTAPLWPNTNYGDEVGGLSVDEVLADIDWQIRPTTPCQCPDSASPSPRLGSRYIGMPEAPIHEPNCRWFIRYRLPWWTRPTPPESSAR